MASLHPETGVIAAVMGVKERVFDPLPRDFSLEDLVPRDSFYRRLEARLDLSFVRELVATLYAKGGRPSVDPVVFFKLQLVMFFEGVRSERELMRVAADRLSVRWYLGYDLHEPLPDHSNLTRTRERFGITVFRRFFERIVEMCAEAGLVRGKELYFDATKVDANASLDSIAPRFAVEAHLGGLFEEDEGTTEAEPEASLPAADDAALRERNAARSDWIARNGRQRREVKGVWYRRTADFLASETDPDSSPMKRRDSKGSHLGYYTRSEEHTSELQSRQYLVCRLLLEKKKIIATDTFHCILLELYLHINDTFSNFLCFFYFIFFLFHLFIILLTSLYFLPLIFPVPYFF